MERYFRDNMYHNENSAFNKAQPNNQVHEHWISFIIIIIY